MFAPGIGYGAKSAPSLVVRCADLAQQAPAGLLGGLRHTHRLPIGARGAVR